jgi:hypothetical protein
MSQIASILLILTLGFALAVPASGGAGNGASFLPTEASAASRNSAP